MQCTTEEKYTIAMGMFSSYNYVLLTFHHLQHKFCMSCKQYWISD